MHRICQGLAFGATGVKGRWSVHDRRWHSVVAAGGVPSREAVPPVAIVGLGNASAGWGSCISRPISAPVSALTDFFRREYCSSGGVQRGVHRGAVGQWRCSMHLVSVDEYRSSQTCSRCFNLASLTQHHTRVHKLKQCAQRGQLQGGPTRQPDQCHNLNPRPLIVDRDINAARVLTARAVYDLFPGWMLDRQQREQLESCLMRRSAAAAGAEGGGE